MENIFNQIQTFVRSHTADHTDQHTVFIRFQSHLFHQFQLVYFLVLDMFCIIILIDVFIGLWIIVFDINSVEDTDDAIAFDVQNWVQTM